MERSLVSGRSPVVWLLLASTLLSLAIGLAGYMHTSPGTPVAIHFGLDGAPNGWASPGRAFFMLPLTGIGLLLLPLLAPVLKPETDRVEMRILAVLLGVAGILLAVAQVYIFWRAV